MIDGFISQVGVDAATNPLSLQRIYNSNSVNRKYRGGYNQTRDPFKELELTFDSQSTETVFRKGNVSGVYGYKKLTAITQPHVVVAVGDSILAGRLFGNQLSFRTLYKGISPQWEHSFFVQAEDILVWQNGKDLPLYWDGVSNSMSYAKDAPGVETAMPIGNIMVYAHGRIFLCTEENIVYASNHLYSQGFGKNTAILNFHETTYWSDGDGFGTPSILGRITGASVIPRNPQPNGHGPVIIFCENGAWSIDASKDRSLWQKDENIQSIVLVGRGCGAHQSVTQVNNDLWYRCSDRSISSFRHAYNTIQNEWTNTPLSRQVQKYLDYDTRDVVQFSDGIHFNNRMIMSCCHRRQVSEVDGFGNHRFGLGLVSCDLDSGTDGIKWDGLWTGPRVTGIVELFEYFEKRALFFSFDKDGNNRIYELVEDSSNDLASGKDVQIASWFITSALFSPKEDAAGNKLIIGTRLDVDDIYGSTSIEQQYQPEFYPCWTPFQSTEKIEASCEPEDAVCHSGFVSKKQSGSLVFKKDCNSPRIGSNSTTDIARTFNIKTKILGRASIRRMLSEAQEQNEDLFSAGINCTRISEPISCCSEDNELFEYTIV